MANNIGFRRDKNRVITYDQEKLAVSSYYDKRVVADDLIHTKNLFFKSPKKKKISFSKINFFEISFF